MHPSTPMLESGSRAPRPVSDDGLRSRPVREEPIRLAPEPGMRRPLGDGLPRATVLHEWVSNEALDNSLLSCGALSGGRG